MKNQKNKLKTEPVSKLKKFNVSLLKNNKANNHIPRKAHVIT